ncbi:MAG: hypothetical protein NC110_07925 [Ruminococcus sp.]|nr:hypothetical protein [Ruminococcus sp.]
MNLENINMESLNEVISSLSADDIEALSGMAQSLFSSADSVKSNEEKSEKPKPQNDSSPAFDFGSIAKIASIMEMFTGSSKDPRCDLLNALKPMLAEEKQDKVDQAIKMIKLISILPKIKELNE